MQHAMPYYQHQQQYPGQRHNNGYRNNNNGARHSPSMASLTTPPSPRSLMGSMNFTPPSPRLLDPFYDNVYQPYLRDMANPLVDLYMMPPPPLADLYMTPPPPLGTIRSRLPTAVSTTQQSHSFTSSDSRVAGNRSALRKRTNLPAWACDANGVPNVRLERLIEANVLEAFAKDRAGCECVQSLGAKLGFRYLQREIRDAPKELKQLAIDTVSRDGRFDDFSNDVFANFFVQRLMEKASDDEQDNFVALLRGSVVSYCRQRYACRVIQAAIESFSNARKVELLKEIHPSDVMELAIGQNSNHVIQKVRYWMLPMMNFQIMTTMPSDNWEFIVQAVSGTTEGLSEIVSNKYGCRIVQLTIERLLEESKIEPNAQIRLKRVLDCVLTGAQELVEDEFANYVIQLIIRTPGLERERDFIIKHYILRGVLSYSQEKYASHVVECAFQHAPPALLVELMDETFDGYLPDESGRDALDIMLFHQFANYVVQRILEVTSAYAKVNDSSKLTDYMKGWHERLRTRIRQQERKLTKYSSGQKLIKTVSMEECEIPPSPTSR